MANFVTSTLAFLGPIGWQEMIILAILGVLIFGKRLPEVGKSIGKGIVEFKKGLAGLEDDADRAASEPRQPPRIESRSSGVEARHDAQPGAAATAPPPDTGAEPGHNVSA